MRRDTIIAIVLEKLDSLAYMSLSSDDAFTIIQEELGNNYNIFNVDIIDEIHQSWEEHTGIPAVDRVIEEILEDGK